MSQKAISLGRILKLTQKKTDEPETQIAKINPKKLKGQKYKLNKSYKNQVLQNEEKIFSIYSFRISLE